MKELFINTVLFVIFSCIFSACASNRYQTPLHIGKKCLTEGDYAQAVVELQKAHQYASNSSVSKKTFAFIKNELGSAYWRSGRYNEAKELHLQALALREEVFGPNHKVTSISLNNLALVYQYMGEYDKAEPLFKRVLAIREEFFGSEHLWTSTSLNNLALLYQAMGEYDKAEPLLQRALAIREKALGSEHPLTALSLNNLALLYQDIGEYDKAEPLCKRALAIREKALGSEHPSTATSLNNLALLYQCMGEYDKAESLCKRALAIQEKALGPEHPSTATSLNNLALLYQCMGEYDKAEPLLQRALTIREKTLGPEHPSTANSLDAIGVQYKRLGEYEKSKIFFRKAIAIDEKSLGQNHTTTAKHLCNYGVAVACTGRILDGFKIIARGQAVYNSQLLLLSTFASENKMLDYLANSGYFYSALMSLSINLNEDRSCNAAALNTVLRRKGMVLESQRRLFQNSLQKDPNSASLFQELSMARIALSNLYFKEPTSPQGVDSRRDSLVLKIETLEAELSRKSVVFTVQERVSKADVAALAEVLPSDAALVEFVLTPLYNFRAVRKEPRWLPAHYLAFVVRARKPDDVQLVDLGPAEAIDKKIRKLRLAISNLDPYARPARALHDLAFAPLAPLLHGVRTIYAAPDGMLNLIPFEVLMGAKKRFLVEDYSLVYLPTGRDLLRIGMDAGPSGPAVVLGNPAFDNAMSAERDKPAAGSAFHFSALPGTEKEAVAVRKLLGPDTVMWLKTQATEDRLLKVHAPRVLHMATHGFFLEDRQNGESPESAETDVRGRKSETGWSAKVENPMLRSGLALAGANAAVAGLADDGVLSALEALNLDLSGTELVVLSACNTGVGKVKTGQGVYGLRRAFLQAGARSLVMSLWEAPDAETISLMTSFYTNLNAAKENRAQALRQAMLTEIRNLKKQHGDAHPFYWGAFVFLGDPGPSMSTKN
ncbi:MAG: tetratricopeptide repeat protein [Desulfomicrobium sp.]